jgi:hypothetical protein
MVSLPAALHPAGPASIHIPAVRGSGGPLAVIAGSNPIDVAVSRTPAPLVWRYRSGFSVRDFQHVPARVDAGDQPGEFPDPIGKRIEGVDGCLRDDHGIGAGASHGDDLDWRAEFVETLLQFENDLVLFDAKKVMPSPMLIPDGEYVDMARRDLQGVTAVVEQFRATAIEGDRGGGSGFRSRDGLDLLEEGFDHSCATSFA